MDNFNELEIIDMQLQALVNKKKALSSENVARKARTRRLIQTGALAEKYFRISPSMTLEERENFFKKASNIIKCN